MASVVELVRAARAHQNAGRLAEAGQVLEACRRIAPEDINYLIALADFLRAKGRIDESALVFRSVLDRAPGLVAVYDNLALMLAQHGRQPAAEEVLRLGLKRNPGVGSLLRNLAVLLVDTGRSEEGLVHLREAIADRPDDADLRMDLGNLLVSLRRFVEAEAAFRSADGIRSGDAGILNNIANVLRHQMRLSEAEAAYRDALALHPDDPDLHANLGGTLRLKGEVAAAKEHYVRALELRWPWPEVHSNLIFCLDFDAGAGLEAQADARRAWREANEVPLATRRLPPQGPGDPDRVPLRVGYVSADFNLHSASDGFGSVILNHDRAAFHVSLYSNGGLEDARTEEFAAACDRFRRVRMMPDTELADRIRADGIDILVDLSGHSAGNRLPVFARRPAPVQATGWGYATSTGMTSMDYLLADRWLVPWENEGFYTEDVVGLPCVMSYRVPDRLPAVSPPPMLANGFPTFGSFNRLAKVSIDCMAAWARVLREVPGSRLVLKCMSLEDAGRRSDLRRRFSELGVASDRLDLLGTTSRRDQLEAHRGIDVALDSFRHCGGVTTCEALVMGVPVVTLCGDVPVARNGASLLSGLGCPEWIAGSVDEYVAIARQLVGDGARLMAIRAALRQLLLASPLGDNRAYTRAVETAYRQIWLRHCMGLGRGA